MVIPWFNIHMESDNIKFLFNHFCELVSIDLRTVYLLDQIVSNCIISFYFACFSITVGQVTLSLLSFSLANKVFGDGAILKSGDSIAALMSSHLLHSIWQREAEGISVSLKGWQKIELYSPVFYTGSSSKLWFMLYISKLYRFGPDLKNNYLNCVPPSVFGSSCLQWVLCSLFFSLEDFFFPVLHRKGVSALGLTMVNSRHCWSTM